MRKVILILLVILIAGLAVWYFMFNGMTKFESFGIARKNSENISKLKLGMNKSEVLQIMGKPYKAEAFSFGKDKRVVEFLFYRTKGLDVFFMDGDQNFTPLAIDNENAILINWDWKFYNEVTQDKLK